MDLVHLAIENIDAIHKEVFVLFDQLQHKEHDNQSSST